MEQREKLKGIVFARSLCAVGIVLFHYASHTKSSYKILYKTPNDYWGSILVTAFFTISGMVLYYNYPKIESLKVFYYKRWKSIYPSFYLCFAVLFVLRVLRNHRLFNDSHPLTLLLSLAGIDGYFSAIIPNYYMIGEWFLGALILLYLVYPLLLWLVNTTDDRLVLAVLVVAQVIEERLNLFVVFPGTDHLTCLLCFYMGIVIGKHYCFFSGKLMVCVAMVYFVISMMIQISLPFLGFNTLLNKLQGVTFLIVANCLGVFLMKDARMDRLFSELANISFPMFLLQHIIIIYVQKIYNPVKVLPELGMILLVVVLTIIGAKIVSVCTMMVTESKLFKGMEKRIFKTEQI